MTSKGTASWLAVLLSMWTVGVAAQERPVATTASGKVAGVTAGDVQAFKGIPYAAPPVGPLRWRPPAPAVSWSDVRDGSRFGAACAQPPGRQESWARVGPTSEDCLFLNVWRPAKAGRYPVMVFLHGGGFTYGAAGVPLYDGANLARRGAVVVTINYRMGLLGFFAHPALTRDDPKGPRGNYGVMDAVAALRWVRDNAAAFGGDAGNVTLFGESAGAGMVQILMATPAADGLFAKAVSESGAGGTILPTYAAVEAIGAKLGAAAGLPPSVTAAQLRAIPTERLLLRSFPFVDGEVVTASPGTPFARGRERRLPLLIGANSNEATLSANSEELTRKVLGARYDEWLRRYAAAGGGDVARAKVDLAEDALSILPSMTIAALHAKAGAPAWSFYFDQVPANRRAGSAGSPHGGEIEYLFGNPDEGSTWDDADRAVSREMGDRWVAFARSGVPDAKGAPAWPRVGTPPLAYLTMGTPSRAERLSPLREEVRQAALAVSAAGWSAEP